MIWKMQDGKVEAEVEEGSEMARQKVNETKRRRTTILIFPGRGTPMTKRMTLAPQEGLRREPALVLDLFRAHVHGRELEISERISFFSLTRG